MKVAFFLVGMMRQGHNKPAYELFISPDTGEFITWDCELQRWSEAKIDNLKWPDYKRYISNCYINNCGYNTIKTVLNVSKGGWAGILEYQNNVRKEELKRKHRRETDPWDLDMEQIPALPKDWEHWVNKTAIQENFIFYQYKRGGAKEGWCTYCEKWVPIKEPRHNAAGKCKVCHKPITYKSAGKAGRFNTKTCYVYLMQKCEDGFVIREFEAYRHYQKNMYGITVVLHTYIEIGKDSFNMPIHKEVTVDVENVLVAPSSTDDIVTSQDLYGKKAIYTLAIPKGDTHDWFDTTVEFFGRKWKTFGYPIEGIEENIPLSWNKKVMVEAYG